MTLTPPPAEAPVPCRVDLLRLFLPQIKAYVEHLVRDPDLTDCYLFAFLTVYNCHLPDYVERLAEEITGRIPVYSRAYKCAPLVTRHARGYLDADRHYDHVLLFATPDVLAQPLPEGGYSVEELAKMLRSEIVSIVRECAELPGVLPFPYTEEEQNAFANAFLRQRKLFALLDETSPE